MLAQEDLDAVYVLLPPYAHEPEWDVIEAGCALFGEKLVHLNLAEAIRDEIARRGLISGVGYMTRYRKDDAGRVHFHYVVNYVRSRYLSGEHHARSDARQGRWVTEADPQPFPCTPSPARLLFGFFGKPRCEEMPLSCLRRLWPVLVALVIAALLLSVGLWITRPYGHNLLLHWTGEEELLPQVRGMLQLGTDLIRPRLKLEPLVPIAHAGVNPFGCNTFLQQEVELWKREESLRLLHEAGFQWIRQEFPWEDIEVHAKGDFTDCRHEQCISAWEKYDYIVELAYKYGIEIIARLSNPPAWSRHDGDARGTFAPPDNLTDFGDFVEAVVRRYQGRVRYYQIWNEPNIYPEWGEQPVDPVGYTALLREAYIRAKAVDPEVIIICGALAPTIELGPRDMNDLLFLQRMYDAGAGEYFDVMSVQGYGLWSGPYDRRMRPITINFSRNLFIRDIMVKNGDAHKPIWISEMNWNALPSDHPSPPYYGRVTLEQQARYAVEAYQRAQAEWPWVGVVNFWFFKRASDAEQDQAWYYFRMMEPDFTPLPVYEALKAYANQRPVMYQGFYQEDHWAVRWAGNWKRVNDGQAVLGTCRRTDETGAQADFTFHGHSVALVVTKGADGGQLRATVDGGRPRVFNLRAERPQYGVELAITSGLRPGSHHVTLEVVEGPVVIDGFIVRSRSFPLNWILAGSGVALVLGAVVYGWQRGMRWRRQH